MRDAVGEPETAKDEATPAEIVLAIYGVFKAAAHDEGIEVCGLLRTSTRLTLNRQTESVHVYEQ
jgi:hypothetical protein